MSTLSLQITFQKGRPLVAYIYLKREAGQKVARTERVDPDVLIDYSAEGAALGIEIITPAHVSLDAINAAFDRIGIARPTAQDLAPIQAI